MASELDLAHLARHPRPTYGLSVYRWLVYRLTWHLVAFLHSIWWRVRPSGHENLPKDGPYLILPNHTMSLDPWILAYALYRPMQFMASAQSLTVPILGPMLKAMGAFPKVKYVKDVSSMRYMTDLYDNGQVVTIFPEGRRSWDGHTLKIMPGIGRTILRMNARIVIARMYGNYFMQPRWAKYPRWVPTDIEYEGPITYPADMSPDEVTADIQARLQTPPRLRAGARTWGFRIAEGLTKFLWACPQCFTLEGLVVTGAKRDHVACRSCGSRWRLDIETRLHPSDGTASITVRDAFKKLDAHFGTQPVQDKTIAETSGVVLQDAHARVFMVPRKAKKKMVAQGALRLRAGELEVVAHGETLWSVPLADLVAVSVELGSRTQIRTEDALYELDVPGGSVLKWGHFLKRWRFPEDPEPVG